MKVKPCTKKKDGLACHCKPCTKMRARINRRNVAYKKFDEKTALLAELTEGDPEFRDLCINLNL